MLEEVSEPQRHQFTFHGRALDYFGIWIVNLVLTIITLGIYSAWAKVRTNRYFYGNTQVAGSSFDYTANPKKILLGRTIAVAMLFIYQFLVMFAPTAGLLILALFGLAIPFVYLSSLAFRMRYSQWRNINFGFQRDVGKAYLLLLPLVIFIILSIAAPLMFGITPEDLAAAEDPVDNTAQLSAYLSFSGFLGIAGLLLFPLWQRFYYKFIGDRVRLGRAKFSIELKIRSFYAMYIAALLIVIGLTLLAFFLSGALLLRSADPALQPGVPSLLTMLFRSFLFLSPYLIVLAFIKTALTNLLYSNIRMDNVVFECDLKLGRMIWLYLTNTLAIIVTLGLAVPWSKVRLARYRAERMAMVSQGDIEVLAAESGDVSASGEAMTDLFDLDIGL